MRYAELCDRISNHLKKVINPEWDIKIGRR
jgi:hypothetical protein